MQIICITKKYLINRNANLKLQYFKALSKKNNIKLELLVLDMNTWNYLKVCKQMNSYKLL